MRGEHNMLGLRPYKACDADTIISWIGDETAFRRWSSDRYDHYPITAADMNAKYIGSNGDCAEPDNFYPMTAFDDSGIVGHLIMRYTDEQKKTLRFGFVIVDGSKRGQGLGKKMISLALRYAFEIYGAEKVTIGVFDNNPAALGCYLAAGFGYADEQPSYCEIMGETWKCVELCAVNK